MVAAPEKYPTYAVEVSGCDQNEDFFVEETDLFWGQESVREQHSRSALNAQKKPTASDVSAGNRKTSLYRYLKQDGYVQAAIARTESAPGNSDSVFGIRPARLRE